jgi:hypothetical protein
LTVVDNDVAPQCLAAWMRHHKTAHGKFGPFGSEQLDRKSCLELGKLLQQKTYPLMLRIPQTLHQKDYAFSFPWKLTCQALNLDLGEFCNEDIRSYIRIPEKRAAELRLEPSLTIGKVLNFISLKEEDVLSYFGRLKDSATDTPQFPFKFPSTNFEKLLSQMKGSLLSRKKRKHIFSIRYFENGSKYQMFGSRLNLDSSLVQDYQKVIDDQHSAYGVEEILRVWELEELG